MAKRFKNKKLYWLLAITVILVTSGFKCGAPPAGLTPGKPESITLNYWKVWEDSFNISELVELYQKEHPHIAISYRNLTAEEYENELLRAFAEDRGPDIFSINTTWMRAYQTLIQPLPPEIKIQYVIQKGTIKKETFTELRTLKTLTLRDVKSLYPDVVYDNQVIDSQIYGLPLSIDTLALYYNRDLLNNAGITSPPKTWDEFRSQVSQLTKLDLKGNVIQAGAAIGTADNVARAADILSLLMMQDGTVMTDSRGFATFDKVPENYNRAVKPSVEALNFYTSFASPAKQSYTWNVKMPNSLQAFMSGSVAFFFGYAYHLPIIKAQAPKLNFEITEVPQVGNPVNFASYWAETVSKKSKHLDEAWDFILFITANSENNKKFLERSQKPTALRMLIDAQKDDLELAPFANQLISSRSWYKGKNASAAEKIFNSMINDDILGNLPTANIIDLGVNKINQTL